MSSTRRRLRSRGGAREVDLSYLDMSVEVGSVALPNPVMVASGTAGHGAELGAFLDLSGLGAVVVKSLAAFAWDGNPAPRVHQATAGMLNSVGLQGPGIAAWAKDELPVLIATGARVVVSIWGRTIEDYHRAAELVADLPDNVVAVEVNLSCPNLDGGAHLFAHDPAASHEVISGCGVAGRPMWAKLSPNTDRVIEVARAVSDAGAEAVTLTNTMLGMAIDIERRTYRLGAGGGGFSGPAMHPIAVRIVHDVHAAIPDLPIIGVGGVASAHDVIEFMMVGASAVQIGTANFANPAIAAQIAHDVAMWCHDHGVKAISELTGAIRS